MVDSAVNAAVASSRNGKIGVIGTPGTINSGAYETKIKAINGDIVTYSKGCPLFVPLVENGHFTTEVARLVVEEYLEGIKKAGVDTLILGCTHYPLLKETIGAYMGDNVTLIDSGAEVAKHLKRRFDEEKLHSTDDGEGQYSYYVSDNVDSFVKLGGTFLQREINGQVRKIDIEKY